MRNPKSPKRWPTCRYDSRVRLPSHHFQTYIPAPVQDAGWARSSIRSVRASRLRVCSAQHRSLYVSISGRTNPSSPHFSQRLPRNTQNIRNRFEIGRWFTRKSSEQTVCRLRPHSQLLFLFCFVSFRVFRDEKSMVRNPG